MRKMSKWVTYISCFAICVTLCAATGARTKTDKETDAINLVRIINTAEAEQYRRSGSYASLDELKSSGAVKSAISLMRKPLENVGSPVNLADYLSMGLSVKLVVTKSSYFVSIHDQAKPTCGRELVSDEGGLVRRAVALDCAEVH